MKKMNKKGMEFSFTLKNLAIFIVLAALLAIIVYFIIKFIPHGISFARMFGR